MSSAVSNAGMEASAPLINAIVNSAVFHSNSHINQMPLQIVHILRFFGRLAAPDFVMILSGLFGSQKSGSLYGSVTLLHFRTGGSEWCKNIRVDRARGKDNDQQNISKMIM